MCVCAGFVIVGATLLVVAMVTLRPLGSILVSALVCRHRSEFSLAMAVCVLLPKTAVVRPTSMLLRDVLVQLDAIVIIIIIADDGIKFIHKI